MRVPGLLILLLAILAVQAVFLNEAFSANGGSPSEAFGSSQGGAQVQLMASRPVYYVAGVPSN